MLELKEIRREYQMGPVTVKALDGVSISIQEGEFVSIIGPSGSGKSTLMNLIGCLDTPTSGHYFLAGDEVGSLSPDRLAEIRNLRIGFVFQNFNLLSRASAAENIELPLIYRGIPSRKRKEQALLMLEKVGLSDRADHMPNELSGGQRQRVAIARALVGNPSVLLADEPTGALDTKTGAEIMTLFDDLHREGMTLILVTHDQTLAERAERTIRLLDGRIAGIGEKQHEIHYAL